MIDFFNTCFVYLFYEVNNNIAAFNVNLKHKFTVFVKKKKWIPKRKRNDYNILMFYCKKYIFYLFI